MVRLAILGSLFTLSSSFSESYLHSRFQLKKYFILKYNLHAVNSHILVYNSASFDTCV